jgi:hypothetical protein
VFIGDCAVAKLISVSSYPNPFTENFKLNLTSTSEENVGITIYDMTGRLIEQKELNLKDVSEFTLGDNYPSGIYNIIVIQGDEMKTTRIIKK